MTQPTTRGEPGKPAEPDAPSLRPESASGAAAQSARARRHEYRFFLAMVGLVALHVADDSFLQPQPGTTAGDHLVSGLVPLTVLALAAFSYPRVRAGPRAVIALLVGYFGIVVGIEAAYYTARIGPSGDDFTGLLSIPAGIVLIGLGVAALWRSRRRDGGLPKRILRRAAIAVASVLVAAFGLVWLGYAYVATHVARPPVDDIDLGSATVEQVQLHTSDGLTLEGSYVPSENGAAVIVAFGRKGTQRPARMLARHGYGVLIFDRRGEGESDGDPNPYAWDEGELDLLAAIAFLKQRPDVEPDRIGGVGLSVGGETLLQAAARSKDLQAVVSEGASVRSFGELRSVPGSEWGPLVVNAVMTAGTALFSDAAPPEHLIDQVDEIAPRAMFLIHAPKADPDEKRFNTAFYRAAGEPKAIWGVPEAGHVGAQEARPREYEQRVTRFFDQTLGAEQQ
jgi:alpha/beta superfamily hydrolase